MGKHIEFSDHWQDDAAAVAPNVPQEARSPQQIIREIAENYTDEERRQLVRFVGEAAVAKMNPTYVNPFVKNAGIDALSLAVGLHELPEEQGDN